MAVEELVHLEAHVPGSWRIDRHVGRSPCTAILTMILLFQIKRAVTPEALSTSSQTQGHLFSKCTHNHIRL